MSNVNPRIGSSFDSRLVEKSIREDATAAAIKSVVAMKERGLMNTRSTQSTQATRSKP